MHPFTHETMSRPFVSIPRTLIVSFAAVALLSLRCGTPAAAVEYRVRFDATWSVATHPTAYTNGAHFSPLIGTTHNDQISFWEPGGIASDAIEVMAETGNPSALKFAFLTAGTDTGERIQTGVLSSPDTIATTFNITPSHPLVTLVTMVAPSPDWFVGVSGLELYDGGAWVPQVTIDLFAYDAGTDSGVSFRSDDADVTPHLPITLLGDPFTGTPALGTFTFTLVGDGNLDGVVDGLDYLVWAGAFGDDPAADPPGSPANGDYDDNGRVDGADYLAWAGNYGAGIATAVPEPGALALLLVGTLASGLVRRRSS